MTRDDLNKADNRIQGAFDKTLCNHTHNFAIMMTVFVIAVAILVKTH